jgi:hypothetical protein
MNTIFEKSTREKLISRINALNEIAQLNGAR